MSCLGQLDYRASPYFLEIILGELCDARIPSVISEQYSGDNRTFCTFQEKNRSLLHVVLLIQIMCVICVFRVCHQIGNKATAAHLISAQPSALPSFLLQMFQCRKDDLSFSSCRHCSSPDRETCCSCAKISDIL